MLLAKELPQQLTSPGYPEPYLKGQESSTDIEAPEGFAVRLVFQHFDLEPSQDCEQDSVTVSCGGGPEGTLGGSLLAWSPEAGGRGCALNGKEWMKSPSLEPRQPSWEARVCPRALPSASSPARAPAAIWAPQSKREGGGGQALPLEVVPRDTHVLQNPGVKEQGLTHQSVKIHQVSVECRLHLIRKLGLNNNKSLGDCSSCRIRTL